MGDVDRSGVRLPVSSTVLSPSRAPTPPSPGYTPDPAGAHLIQGQLSDLAADPLNRAGGGRRAGDPTAGWCGQLPALPWLARPDYTAVRTSLSSRSS
ncbi:MAG: hypothetical protein M3332_19095 [Actinomycetota bacterium]|nr:hypothetical protein [Actinomycetota bacterium]